MRRHSRQPSFTLVLASLLLTSCGSIPGTLLQSQTAFPPQKVMETGDYRGFLAENQRQLSACAVVVPVTLLFISPVLAYVAFGGYLFFWGCQSIHLAIRQAREYRIMRRYKVTDWDERLRHLTDPYTRMHALADRPRLSEGEAEELVALNHWVHTGPDVPAPDEMRHLIVMPVANEDALDHPRVAGRVAADRLPQGSGAALPHLRGALRGLDPGSDRGRSSSATRPSSACS